MRQSDIFNSVLDGFVVSSAVWTIYCNLLVYSGANFRMLVSLSFMPVVIAGGLLYCLWRLKLKRPATSSAESPICTSRIPLQFKLLGAAAIVLVYAWTRNYLLFWVFTVGFLVFIVLDKPPSAEPRQPSKEVQKRWAKWVVVALILFAVAITLVAHRPDIDDAFYLNIAISSHDFPDRPLLQFDGMFGEEGLPILDKFYRAHSYELFVALASSLTSLPAGSLYYIVLPVVFAALVVIAHWVVLRYLSGQTALLGLLLVFIVLLSWGEGHHTYGNFSFVRLYQGKGVLVSVIIPAIVYYAGQFAKQRDLRSWLCLALAQIAAVGFSSSGLVVAPLTAGTVLLGVWRPQRPGANKMLFLGLMASAYLMALGMLIRAEMMVGGGSTPTGASSGIETDLMAVLGQGWRAYLALFALLAAPALPKALARHRGISGFALMVVLLVLNPLTPRVLTKVMRFFAWRIFWCVPFPLIIGLAGAGLAAVGAKIRCVHFGIVGFIALTVVFALAPGNWTLSPQNFTRLAVPGYKVDSYYKIAQAVVAATPSDGLVLAPSRVSAWVPTFPRHPRLVAVRPNYFKIISEALGESEANRRRMMLDFVEGTGHASRWFPEVMREIQQRSVATVVIPRNLPYGPAFEAELKVLGYVRHSVETHELWIRKGNS